MKHKKRIGADFLHTVSGEPIRRGVVTLDPTGKVVDIDRIHDTTANDVAFYTGHIIPGLVNTHCHLELSHMKGLVPTGTGLISFISKVVTLRDFPESVIQAAIAKAEQEMIRNGIVAVGDISNQLDTLAQKSKSRLRYYNFVELFDLLQANVEEVFAKYRPVYDGFSQSAKSFVPHAPYSVSDVLFRAIVDANQPEATISIHNQETPAEDDFFEKKTGNFLTFYKKFNLPLDNFKKTKRPSIYKTMEHLDPKMKTLFVHNTLTGAQEIKDAQAWSEHTFWATCPNANLYIENRLPNYQAFLNQDARVTIGTDSLTSNWRLSIFDEMKTISKYQSYIPFDQLLRWATLNGAEALSMNQDIGSIDIGKTPGLNLITGMGRHGLTRHSRLKVLATAF